MAGTTTKSIINEKFRTCLALNIAHFTTLDFVPKPSLNYHLLHTVPAADSWSFILHSSAPLSGYCKQSRTSQNGHANYEPQAPRPHRLRRRRELYIESRTRLL